MEISSLSNFSYYTLSLPKQKRDTNFQGNVPVVLKKGVDEFVKKPVLRENATGFLDYIKSSFNTYKKNIRCTYNHKIIFAIVEKELYGRNSLDSITHDLDKLILYILGFPREFVSSFHRKHSSHHTESGKKLNLKSMVCDNIASSPVFKPQKHYLLRDYFERTPELQQVEGLKEKLMKYNFGEDLNIKQIKRKSFEYCGITGVIHTASKALSLLLTGLLLKV